jgi:hypothetical protein
VMRKWAIDWYWRSGRIWVRVSQMHVHELKSFERKPNKET